MKLIKIFSIVLLFVATNLMAQETKPGVVSGKIIDKTTNEPVGFSTVSVLDGTKPVAGVSTKEDGSFEIKNLELKNLTLKVNFIGYKDGIFNFRDSPGGADTSQPNVIVWGKLGVGTSDFSSLPGTGLVIGNTGAQALGIKDGGDIAIYSPNNGSSASFYVDDGTSNTLTLNSNGKIFNFNGTGGSVSSDIRLKQDIVKVDNCLDKILNY